MKKIDRPSEYFRAGVGAIIVDDIGRALALERSDIPGAWQLPLGGLEKGEEPADAVLREIDEETGISQSVLDLVDQYPDLLAYELPTEARTKRTGRGQVQYWFLFRFKGDESEIDITKSEEFVDWRWMSVKQLLTEVVNFRAGVYQRLTGYFAEHLLLE